MTVSKLSSKYGDITKKIPYHTFDYAIQTLNVKDLFDYSDRFMSIDKSIFVFESAAIVIINGSEYTFRDIISVSVSDNSQTIYSDSVSTTSTKTGSMIGRSIVGEALLGNAGALIGGATAKKETITSGQTATMEHNYTISITVNCLSNPLISIQIGNRENLMQEIVSVMSIIIDRNK